MNITQITNGARRGLLVVAALVVTGGSIAGMVAKANAITAPRAQISFTFDDGLNSALALAAPALKDAGYTGTDYIISNCARDAAIAGSCAADETKTYMSWDQIKTLRDTYGWEIGSHTETHPLLDPNDTTVPANQRLTAAQIDEELKGSQAAIAAATGQTPTAFAAPYGSYDQTGNIVVSDAAKYYTSFRGFADYGYNYFPYNNFLLNNLPVQDGALLRGETVKANPVTQAEQYIDEAVAGNRWLVLTFHDITADGTALTGTDDYDLNVGELKQIAAYAKSKGIFGTNVSNGLVTNPGGGNLVTNSGFEVALSTTADTTNFNTDATTIKQDTAGHGTGAGFATSASLVSGAADASLFSNTVAIQQKTYVIQAYLNILSILTGSQVTFQVDEYNAAHVYTQTQTLLNTPNPAGPNPLVKTVGFEYTPTVGTAYARLQIVAKGGSSLQAFVDNVTWFAEDGSTTNTVASNGDVNGDGKIDALDLSVILGNFNKASTSVATGDLNGDKTVDALDLSLVLTNWSK